MCETSSFPKRRPSWLWLGLLWIAFMVSPPFEGSLYLGLGLMALLLIWGIWRRSWKPILILMLMPASVGLTFGALDWFSLRPARHCLGYPGREFFNLDAETRTYRSTGGCIIDPGAVLSLLPHNLGLESMCWLFGQPPRTYGGLYPSKEEADHWTHEVPPVPLKTFISGMVPVGQQQVDIHPAQAHEMLRTLALNVSFQGDADEKLPVIRAHAASPDCLLIRISCSSRKYFDREPVDAVFLLDRARLWPFAAYDLAPNSSFHAHPYFAYYRDVSELTQKAMQKPPDFSGPLY